MKGAPKPLACAPAPCGSCPYRRDTPPGVWAPEEYEKLRDYAAAIDPEGGMPHLGVFLCHHTPALDQVTVCRGWLTVEQDSLAVRVALIRGTLTAQQVQAPAEVPLYATGADAAAAGLAGVADPSPAAERVIARLLRKRRKRRAAAACRTTQPD